MKEHVITDKSGNRRGAIEEQSNGVRVIRDRNGRRLGEYDPKWNVTRDANGNRLGGGDQLSSLL
jgi:hypothetical protein